MARLQAGSPWFANAIHAAPTELGSAGRPLRYKYVAPAGACTDPCEDPCKEQSLATALQSGVPETVRQTSAAVLVGAQACQILKVLYP